MFSSHERLKRSEMPEVKHPRETSSLDRVVDPNSHCKAKRIVAKECRADSTLFRQLSFLGHAKTLAGIATARPE